MDGLRAADRRTLVLTTARDPTKIGFALQATESPAQPDADLRVRCEITFPAAASDPPHPAPARHPLPQGPKGERVVIPNPFSPRPLGGEGRGGEGVLLENGTVIT